MVCLFRLRHIPRTTKTKFGSRCEGGEGGMRGQKCGPRGWPPPPHVGDHVGTARCGLMPLWLTLHDAAGRCPPKRSLETAPGAGSQRGTDPPLPPSGPPPRPRLAASPHWPPRAHPPFTQEAKPACWPRPRPDSSGSFCCQRRERRG